MNKNRIIPLTPASMAREIGFSNQPRLSLRIKEGRWSDLNLTKLAFTSSSLVLLHFSWLFLFNSKWEEECCNLRESHVNKTKIESKKGNAWGLFKKFKRIETVDKF